MPAYDNDAYDNDNVFAKIIRGEIPCYKVYEDDHVLAFLDIMPVAPGHTLIVPKSPARNLLDVEPDALAAVVKVARRIARAAMAVFEADGISLQQASEAASGQTVFHLHMHVIPRKDGVPLLKMLSRKEKPEVLEAYATRLAAAIEKEKG